MKKTAPKTFIGVRLEGDLLKKVEEYAAAEEWSVSHMSRRLIRLAVNVLESVSKEGRPKVLRMAQGQENISELLGSLGATTGGKKSRVKSSK
jgi:hypothetical protein